ncbi:amidohydrolase family protein [Aquimarina sp. 2201CG5-10]|uniref:amidohydrolase family protein n=1 Tax=Aquimarina callyspongiae TaxID=3098150 RepID=UPI002AB5C07C|nr:amidohydrolase family protein [Aquimarina sp. 2201CG5-10]MDY8137319.1 amidohydrolase family protein [Aquimarina sp. 2201CG5-10]
MHKHIATTLLLGVFLIFNTQAQKNKKDKKEDTKWDVSNPNGEFNYQDHTFSTDEGTWMNLDVSPDGKTIVFDLLGDIYSIPVSGGKAKVLRTGIPFEVQPRFSPDGKKISFTSDAGGGDNIWVMNTDGSDAKQVTKESFRLLNNATWAPDGNYLVARKHFTSQRSLGAGEMWQYHITGGSGLQLTKRKNDQQDVNEPNISPDGRYMYYSEDVYPGGFFQYNKDPNKQIYVIKRYDFETGKTITVTGGPGGAARPQVSRDGKKLAFVKRVRTKTVLYIHDLETGEEWPIFDKLNKDQQEAWAIFGIYPNYSWMPGDKEIVFWSAGKIHKINIENLQVTNIPFTVDATIKIAETLRVDSPVSPKEFTARVIRNAVTSPDGKTLVFSALGKLWSKSLPKGKPQRLTSQTSDFEFEPSFSPDGQHIIYVTWNDENLGSISKVPVTGGASTKITSEKGIYRTPVYNQSNNLIAYFKEGGNNDQGRSFAKKTGIYTMSSSGTDIKLISKEGAYPMFSADGKRIFYQTGGTYFGNLTKTLKSVDLNGQDKKSHIKSKYANRIVPSPDNKWVAFTNLHKAFIAPLVLNGKEINLDNKSKSVPVSQISKDAGVNLHWSKDSKKIFWTLGEEYFSNDIKDRFTFLPNSPEKVAEVTTEGIKVNLVANTDTPSGKIAFTNARIITMEGDQVIEEGTIIIKDNRIEKIGNASDVSVPSDAKIYDVKGKTIMPGIVDAHAHIGGFRYGLTTQKHWQLYANLAFGVTTAHDPSANTESIFTIAELIKNGQMVGPRLYSTGFILYGADGDFKAVVNNLEDARSAIRRTKAFGAKSVKSYNQPRRDQRQQVMQAARELGINVVPEGGSTFYNNMSMIMDGHTGVEHNIPVAPVYKDVTELWKTSNSGYTPTLIVNYGGLNGEYFFYQKDNVWENERLLKYTPRAIVDARSRHRTMAPDEEYENGHILVSKTCAALANSGVKVNLGAHGQLQGLGAHWELWMLHQGGMTNLQALQAATINGANYIGAGNDIGSLKEGKLADLIVLDKNPLENIRNTETVKYTMVNGRLYDTETMNEIGNTTKERTQFWWENNKYNRAFPWHEEAQSFQVPGCGCHIGHN